MRDVIATKDAPQAIGPYSQAIRGNGFVFVSGQVAIDPSTQQVVGGDVAALMRRLAAAAADRDRVDDEARAATTQARFTGLLVVALPAGAALFAELLQPGFLSRVLSEPASAAMLIAAAALQMVGFALIRRLGRPAE